MKISVIGAGYAGLVTGTCFADLGHTIIFVDSDIKKVDIINTGKSPIYEKGIDELLKRNHIMASSKYEDTVPDSDIIFICVDTPSDNDRTLDLSSVKQSCKQVSKCLTNKAYPLIVIKSSTLPGTTEDIVIPLLKKNTKKKVHVDFGIAVNPDFFKEGSAVYDFFHPDRIVIGCSNNKSKVILEELYKDFDCPKIFTNLKTAEMIKFASNAFLSTKLSFINEIGNICKKLYIDVYEVTAGLGYDKRIGRYFLDAGIGWGGPCLSKDINALTEKTKDLGESVKLLESVVTVNELQPLKMLELLKKHLPNLKCKEIGILGLSFKPETDDIRSSRSIPIIRELLHEKAIVKAYDPKSMEKFKELFPMIKYCTPKEILESDAVLILTKWKEFENLNYKGKLIIDGRRVERAKKESAIYEGICW